MHVLHELGVGRAEKHLRVGIFFVRVGLQETNNFFLCLISEFLVST